MMRRRKPWWINSFYDLPESSIIRLKSTRGTVGETSWAKAWVDLLEGAGEKGRLSRAKNCARKGGGSRLRVESGQMRIGICCSGYTIRDVTLLFPKFKDDVRERLVSIVAADAAMTGSILSGDFTGYLVEELQKQKIFLLPKNFREIHTFCGCGDTEHFCIHVAAAWYLFAEILDEHPWHLFTLHGLNRDDLVRMVRQIRDIEGTEQSKKSIPKKLSPDRIIEVPKSGNPQGFFSMAGDAGSLQAGSNHGTWTNPLVLLGSSPAKLGGKNLSDRVESLYPTIREYAEVLLKEKSRREQRSE